MAVPREETQAKLAKLSAATLQHTPSQRYSVADRLEERAAEHPERPFLYFGERILRYAELDAEVNRTAHVAHAAGVRCGDVVALCMENRPDFPVSWMALAKLGATTALINPNARDRALRHALGETGASWAIVGSECLDAWSTLGADAPPPARSFVVPDADADAALPAGVTDLAEARRGAPSARPDPTLRAELRGASPLFYVFTSGTTGLPKAARLSHMRWLGVGDGMSAIAGYGADDVIYCVLPLYHGAGGMVVVSCALAQGAAIALRRRFSASAFWDDVRRHRVTGCQYIGEICRYLLSQPASPRDREHGLRVMMGAGLGPDIWEAFQRRFGIERILEGWSSTEANTSLINLDGVAGSCGRIPFPELHNGRLIRYDVASDSHPRNAAGWCIECGAGEVGEFIGAIPDLPDSGAGRFEGYTSAEATEKKILRGVFAEGDAWYRSGDLLRRDADGYFYFVDRIGDSFRWKSENVSTQEVAEALSGFPGLQIANVYGVRVPGAEGRAGMAALVLADPGGFDGEAFYAWVERRLARYAAPLFVRLAREADVTTTFKLRKVDLQRQGYDPTRVGDPLFLRDDARRGYVPLTPGSLARVGVAPFASDAVGAS